MDELIRRLENGRRLGGVSSYTLFSDAGVHRGWKVEPGRIPFEEDVTLTKVFGIHEIRLRPDVGEGEFEDFITNQYAPAWAEIGWKIHLLKGLRGDRPGKYAVLFEIDSVDALTRYEPQIGSWTDEGQEFLKAKTSLLEKWGSLVGGSMFTDYGVVGQ